MLATPSSALPDWQVAAGTKMAFDVASVRESKPDSSWRGNVSMDASYGSPPTGGLLSVNGFVGSYIIFAYKIGDGSQYQTLTAQLPKWAQTNMFDIEARARGNPTKDEMRLMMQSLLEDRFKLAIHVETRQRPVYVLLRDKPGKLGSQLRPHQANVRCADDPPRGETPVMPRSSPSLPVCNGFIHTQMENGLMHASMENVPLKQIAETLALFGSLNGGLDRRPILDQTGLTGRFDFDIRFTPETNDSAASAGATQPEVLGQTLTQALKDQLGLKLVKETGPVNVFVIDHIERPSDN